MKLKFLLLFLIALNFSSVNNSNSLPRRKLDSTDNNKLLLIGFANFVRGDFNNGNNGDLSFVMYLKKIDNTLNFTDIYFNSTVEYQDGTTNNYKGIMCNPNQDAEYYYQCSIFHRNISNNITTIAINNYTFTLSNFNRSYNFSLSEDQILLSSLAEKTIKKIETQYNDLIFQIFYLNKEPNITKNEVILYGKIDYGEGHSRNNVSFNLNLTESTNCFYYYYNYTGGVESEEITFAPKNNIYSHLNGMMSEVAGSNYSILLFANNTDDLVIYSKDQITYVELLGFGNYVRQNTNENARNLAYFLGTANNLKKYVRFTATIRNTNNSSLRALQATNVNATGDLISIDLETGLAIYDVSYYGTAGMTGNLLIISGNDYKFSNDINNFDSSAVTVIIIGQNINITNPNALIAEFINTMEKPTYSGNSFSFNMRFPNTTQKLNISDKQTMYLDYYNLENSERDEIDCSIENKTSYFTILCEPKKDVYTQFKTLIMKIPNLSSRRLRFLQTAGNSTYLAPLNANGDIQFEYNPEVNTFARKASKKKGLSGGAIAAIVLATVAAIAAVGIAMFFLNRGPVNPIKTSTEMNLPNSTTNINN